jgi:P-type E1-E2 ATPase
MNHLVENYNVKLVLMTGDNPQPAQEMADYINANLVLSRAEPKDKVKFIKQAKDNGAVIAMVGDGVNDAPALALSDVAVAMGKDGTALAAANADVVLMDDDISKLPRLFALGKRCINKARVNIFIAIILNVLGILLSAFGLIVPIGASLYHVVQSLIVVGNSTLILKSKNEFSSNKYEKLSFSENK